MISFTIQPTLGLQWVLPTRLIVKPAIRLRELTACLEINLHLRTGSHPIILKSVDFQTKELVKRRARAKPSLEYNDAKLLYLLIIECCFYLLQSRTVIDDSYPGSPSSDLAGLVAEPSLSGRSHTLTFLQNETLDDDPATTGKQNQWQNKAVYEWTNQQVCNWLMGINMEQYTPQFIAKNIDGQQLLQLDSDKLKVQFCVLTILTV
nr:PREDICTED: uncharacterized protein LOC102367260 [Latimeria chalumnae]|eukprot:XP_014350065.1 PREDICTED: uncharacterized protein LOC102367260 [Latimeria chalumnae]